MNIKYVKIRLRSLFFALEFDRPDFIAGLYLYSNPTEFNNFWTISRYRNIFLHHNTAVVSHTLIEFGVNKQHYLSKSFVDVTFVIVNKLTLRQMWSHVTSIGKGNKSCDFND